MKSHKNKLCSCLIELNFSVVSNDVIYEYLLSCTSRLRKEKSLSQPHTENLKS